MPRATPDISHGDQASLFPEEIRGYLDEIHRVGALGMSLPMNNSKSFVQPGRLKNDPIGDAEDVLRVERARALLLSE